MVGRCSALALRLVRAGSATRLSRTREDAYRRYRSAVSAHPSTHEMSTWHFLPAPESTMLAALPMTPDLILRAKFLTTSF